MEDEEEVRTCAYCGSVDQVITVSGGEDRCRDHRVICNARRCGNDIEDTALFCEDHSDWFMCSQCGSSFSNNYRNDNDECDSCHEENLSSPDWMSSNPYQLRFVSDNGATTDEPVGDEIYLGVELELECRTSLENVRGGSYNWLWHKPDGSLEDGVETVSFPATLEAHRRYVQWKDFLADNRYSLDALTTCGMHVHIGRTALEHGGVDKFILFIYSHEEFVNTVCRRKPGSYRVKEEGGPSKFDRYQIVNITNDHTIEFRQPDSTKNYDTLIAMIEFCHAAVLFTRSMTFSALRRPDAVARFVDYVSARDYPQLTSFLNERGYHERFEPEIAVG